MAYANRIHWIKECLVKNWEHCTEEELTQQILQGESAPSEIRKNTRQMVHDWQNNVCNVRGKFQIMSLHDSEELLEQFIHDFTQNISTAQSA